MKKQGKSPAPSKSAIADPTKLDPIVKKAAESTTGTAKAGDKLLQVVIETPRGSRNKYSFDQDQRTFVLKAALPAGMVFPYDFGFLPKSLAPDGDPIDVLVLMDEPAFPGCVLMVRLIGVIEGEQTVPGKKPTRNDRLVAVAETTHLYSNLTRLKDLPAQALTEIEQFFVNYHNLQGKKYKLLARRGRKQALRLIEAARKAARSGRKG